MSIRSPILVVRSNAGEQLQNTERLDHQRISRPAPPAVRGTRPRREPVRLQSLRTRERYQRMTATCHSRRRSRSRLATEDLPEVGLPEIRRVLELLLGLAQRPEVERVLFGEASDHDLPTP